MRTATVEMTGLLRDKIVQQRLRSSDNMPDHGLDLKKYHTEVQVKLSPYLPLVTRLLITANTTFVRFVHMKRFFCVIFLEYDTLASHTHP